jgi:hypothetical protein
MQNELKRLPGAEIVLSGIADVAAGRKSVNASAVQCAARRCNGSGWTPPPPKATFPQLTQEPPSVRSPADPERIRDLARELGKAVAPGTRMYLTGGATAVLEGWRESTVDVDVRFEPDSDAALARIGEIKKQLSVKVELASPLDFLPALDGWKGRSRFRFREGNLEVFDFDPCRSWSEALSSTSTMWKHDRLRTSQTAKTA